MNISNSLFFKNSVCLWSAYSGLLLRTICIATDFQKICHIYSQDTEKKLSRELFQIKFMRRITYNVPLRWIDFYEIRVTLEIHVNKGSYTASHFKKLMGKFRKNWVHFQHALWTHIYVLRSAKCLQFVYASMECYITVPSSWPTLLYSHVSRRPCWYVTRVSCDDQLWSLAWDFELNLCLF